MSKAAGKVEGEWTRTPPPFSSHILSSQRTNENYEILKESLLTAHKYRCVGIGIWAVIELFDTLDWGCHVDQALLIWPTRNVQQTGRRRESAIHMVLDVWHGNLRDVQISSAFSSLFCYSGWSQIVPSSRPHMLFLLTLAANSDYTYREKSCCFILTARRLLKHRVGCQR